MYFTRPQEIYLSLTNLRDAKYCDVTFLCQDGTGVPANRAFLAARCDYFERMLFGELEEAGSTGGQLCHHARNVLNCVLDLSTSCAVTPRLPQATLIPESSRKHVCIV